MMIRPAEIEYPTEIEYPASLIGAGEAFTVDDDPSNLRPTEITYAGIADHKLFSPRVVGESLGLSSKVTSWISTPGGFPQGTPLLKILTEAWEALIVGDDPLNLMPTETLFSPRVVGESLGLLSKMTSWISTPGGFPQGTPLLKILTGLGEALIVGDDPSSSFTPPRTRHFVIATVESSSSEVVEEIAQASREDMIVSLPEPSPLLKLLVQLRTFQQTPEGERWPGAIWPNTRAFADARTFISRLPLNEIPLPEISLADDGEVNFFWKNDGVYIDLGFYGTETCSYFARGKDGLRHYGEATPASEGLPLEITALFAA